MALRVFELLATVALGERFQPEIAQGLEHPVARFAFGLAHHDE
jgi:hypothetical protein